MHSVIPSRSRCSSSMRSSIRPCHVPDSLAQSRRPGTRSVGSFASSSPISSSVSPTRCANTMNATRRITARGYRRCAAPVRSDVMSPRSS